jgi:hypothetical protein
VDVTPAEVLVSIKTILRRGKNVALPQQAKKEEETGRPKSSMMEKIKIETMFNF